MIFVVCGLRMFWQLIYKVMTRSKQRYYEIQVIKGDNAEINVFGTDGSFQKQEVIAANLPKTPGTAGNPAIAMRGETTTDIDLSEDLNIEEEMMDADIADLFSDDDEDLDSMLDSGDEGDWEDLNKVEEELWEVDEENWEKIDDLP